MDTTHGVHGVHDMFGNLQDQLADFFQDVEWSQACYRLVLG